MVLENPQEVPRTKPRTFLQTLLEGIRQFERPDTPRTDTLGNERLLVRRVPYAFQKKRQLGKTYAEHPSGEKDSCY